jgi:hypothetical protein
MALKFNELIRSRPGLLVIRQTTLEPTLKTLAGLAIMGLITFVDNLTNITSMMFMEELNWPARLVPTSFLLVILLFGLALIVSGIMQIFRPTEYQFDSHKIAYLKNGHIKATIDQLNGVGFSKRRPGKYNSYYQLFLDLKTGKQIKLMKTNSFERAEELTHEINKMLDLPGTENTFIDKYAQTILLIILAVWLLIFIFWAVAPFSPKKNNEKYIPYSGKEEQIKNRNLKGVLFERKFNEKWGWYENGDENRDGKYVGEVALGKPNGLGIYDYSNGDRYEGEWRGGRRNGNGTYTYQDGSKYVGEWKNNINHGRGTFTSADGRKFVGEFKENKFWNIEQINKNGNIINKWINGKKQ